MGRAVSASLPLWKVFEINCSRVQGLCKMLEPVLRMYEEEEDDAMGISPQYSLKKLNSH